MASAVDPNVCPDPNGGEPMSEHDPRTGSLLPPLMLAAGAALLAYAAWGREWSAYSIPAVGVLVLSAYGLLMRWVRRHAGTGNAVVRALEQVRRAIAFESPDGPNR